MLVALLLVDGVLSATDKSPVVAGLLRRGRLVAGRLVLGLEPSFALSLLLGRKV